jgi:hypothetical protein
MFLVAILIHLPILHLNLKQDEEPLQLTQKIQVKLSPAKDELIHQNPKRQEESTSGLNFKSLSPVHDILQSGKSWGASGNDHCIEQHISGIGFYPRSYFLQDITGIAEIRIAILNNKIRLTKGKKGSPLIELLLCKEILILFNKLKGNTCLKSIYERHGARILTYQLSLQVGHGQSENFLQLDNGHYLKQIIEISKLAPTRLAMLAGNIFSAQDLLMKKEDKIEWQRYQRELTRIDCQNKEISFF